MLLFFRVYDLTPKPERAVIGSVIGVTWHKLVFLYNQVHFILCLFCDCCLLIMAEQAEFSFSIILK